MYEVVLRAATWLRTGCANCPSLTCVPQVRVHGPRTVPRPLDEHIPLQLEWLNHFGLAQSLRRQMLLTARRSRLASITAMRPGVVAKREARTYRSALLPQRLARREAASGRQRRRNALGIL